VVTTSTPTLGRDDGRSAVFATTHWSAILTAGDPSAMGSDQALEDLCRTYWRPLYIYARRSGRAPADAQDLTQAFFARLLAGNLVAQADPARGRFRSFLLTSFKNFLANEWEKSRTRKRGGQVIILPLDFDTAETSCGEPAAQGESPDKAFDRQWAMTLLEAVLDRLRQEYADCGRVVLFDGLKESLSGGRTEGSYRELAQAAGLSEGAVKIAAHRLRHRYRELLRAEITRTLASAADVEEELGHLFAALAP
jgi:RNA polymerase sigma-70 factor (ECF subfamily)